MTNLNVLMTTMEYDLIKVGGLSAALTSLTQAIKKYANVHVILPRSGFKPTWRKIKEKRHAKVLMEVFEHDGINVYTLSNDILDIAEVYPEPADETAIKKINEFNKRLTEVVDGIDFDVVHMHDFFAYQAMDKFKEMNRPVLLTIHRLHREYPTWFSGEKIALEKADYITVVGRSYYQEDERKLFKKYENKVTHVFNGMDTIFWNVRASSYPKLSRKERRKRVLAKHGLSDGIFYLYVGRFDPVQKGVDVLLTASEKLLEKENVRMIIVGVGDKKLEKWSKKLAAKYPRKLKIINELLPKEVTRDLYCSADFALVPSIFEPFGLVQLEAMACECIPIGSRTGGIKDTVIAYEDKPDEATGFLIEKGNPKALFDAMRRTFKLCKEKPGIIEKMRKNGRARCEKIFQWDVSSREYLKLYKKLLRT